MQTDSGPTASCGVGETSNADNSRLCSVLDYWQVIAISCPQSAACFDHSDCRRLSPLSASLMWLWTKWYARERSGETDNADNFQLLDQLQLYTRTDVRRAANVGRYIVRYHDMKRYD